MHISNHNQKHFYCRTFRVAYQEQDDYEKDIRNRCDNQLKLSSYLHPEKKNEKNQEHFFMKCEQSVLHF